MSIHKLKSKFNCKACGTCCGSGVVLDLNEALVILKKYGGQMHHLQYDTHFPSGYSVETSFDDGTCLFQKNRHCTIYPDRPFYCREFPLEDGKISQEVDLCPQLDKRGRFRSGKAAAARKK